MPKLKATEQYEGEMLDDSVRMKLAVIIGLVVVSKNRFVRYPNSLEYMLLRLDFLSPDTSNASHSITSGGKENEAGTGYMSSIEHTRV